MKNRLAGSILALVVLASTWPAVAYAQPAPSSTAAQDDGWNFAIYPVMAWVPIGIAIDVNVPPVTGGGGSGPEFGGKIVDGRFDGAFFGGMSASNGTWRIDADGLWAAVGGDRPERPTLRVDVDAIYGHGSLGRKVYGDLYVTAGVRRLALKYDIELGDRNFSRKPGVWDPLVGVGWHHAAGPKLDLHAVFEGGGFGVGADTDIGTSFRLDWKPTANFGLTAGYGLLYFKLSNTLASRTFTATQTMHGPIIGIGLYF